MPQKAQTPKWKRTILTVLETGVATKEPVSEHSLFSDFRELLHNQINFNRKTTKTRKHLLISWYQAQPKSILKHCQQQEQVNNHKDDNNKTNNNNTEKQ